MSDTPGLSSDPASAIPTQGPARRLWELWRQGQNPDVRQYLHEAGALSSEQVLAVLYVDQRERWAAGERVPAETYVQDFSFLQTDDDALIDLVFAEFLIREHLGEAPEAAEYQQRFPRIAESLRQQIAFNQAVQPSTVAEKNPADTDSPDSKAGPQVPGGQRASDQRHDIPASLREHPRYRVIRLLGAGGMGAVYLAEHRLMHRLVALKLINAEYVANPRMIERFRREIDAAARLHHANIVSAFDAEEVQGVHFLAMEYVAGESLHEYLHRQPVGQAFQPDAFSKSQAGKPDAFSKSQVGKPDAFSKSQAGKPDLPRQKLPVREACIYAQQVALGLQHACDKGMVHRDIKPHNLMRTSEGTIKILDFGLAALAVEGQGEGLTGSGVVMGTPDYMAPEQTQDAHAVDIRADIYALGCTLYQMLAGRVPFPGRSSIDKVIAHRQEEVPPLGQLRPEVPVPVCRIVERMLAKSPEDRFQTPQEVADALGKWLTAEVEARKDPPPRKLRVAAWLAGVAALICLAGGVVITITQNGKVTKLDVAPGTKIVVKKSGDIEIDVPKDVKDKLAVNEVRRFGAEGHAIIRLAVSRDGSHVLTASADGSARYWEVATGKLVHRLNSQGGPVNDVAISADGKKLLSCGNDMLIHLWDAATGKEIKQLNGSQMSGLAISRDGNWVASATWDGFVQLWDLEKGEMIHSFLTHAALGVAFSPDGSLLASWGRDTTVRLYDIKQRKEIRCLRGHGSQVRAGAFSADGMRFLSGSYAAGANGNLCLWEVQTGKLLRSIDNIPGGSHGVAIAADGVRALSCGPQGVVHLWDLETGQSIAAFAGLTPNMNDVAFLPDGKHALSGSGHDATIRVWKLPEFVPE